MDIALPSASSSEPPLPAGSTPEAEALYAEVEAALRAARPKEDLAPLRRAYEYAAKHHAGQMRHSGQPYIVHPLEVALILMRMNQDVTALQVAFLHDVVEDTGVTLDDLRKQFGDDVARCVDGVTKLGKLNFYSREDRQAESVRKMLLAMVTDIRVILVKLADRIHNMRTLGAMTAEKRERIAQETLDIYAPIANRLGMGKVRTELEDLAFQNLDPAAYQELVGEIDTRRKANEESLEQMRATVASRLSADAIPARVDARLKRPYSIYLKLRRQKITIDQVYDLMGIRIITDTVKNCYAALGVIHGEWHPIPGRIKDFIAIPRPNLYQSLHTSVIGPGGHTFEIQIRTDEMHRMAEEGIAAHWKYKEGRKGEAPDDQRIQWLRQLVDWQRDLSDPGDFMSTLKVDLYPEEVYTFTPKGKVIVLPRGACPIDFAYAIHSDVGNQCVGAKVNGRIVPLKTAIRNGDVVEIQTQSGQTPSKDWLAFVKTSRARNRIKHFITAEERVRAVEIGQKYLEREARRLSVPLGRIDDNSWHEAAVSYGCAKKEDLYAMLGYGKYSARQVLAKLAPDLVPDTQPEPAAPPEPAPHSYTESKDDKDLVLRVRGLDDLLVYRAKCCNPIKGEAIVGYITRGKGVAVHSLNCPNVQNLMYDADRKIEVEWARAGAQAEQFTVKIVIHTDDRPGMLAQFTQILFQENSNIRSVEAKTDQARTDGSAVVDMVIEVKDKRQLEKVVSAIRRVPGVRDVERVN